MSRPGAGTLLPTGPGGVYGYKLVSSSQRAHARPLADETVRCLARRRAQAIGNPGSLIDTRFEALDLFKEIGAPFGPLIINARIAFFSHIFHLSIGVH